MKFYEDERKRWPELSDAHISDDAARKALKKLFRVFPLEPVPIEFKGETVSYGTAKGIRLARIRSWLTFVHEVAHVWECQAFGDTGHRKRLARVVDMFARYVVRKGWHLESGGTQDDATFLHAVKEHYARE